MNYVASPHFKLNSQPVCFLGVSIQNDKLGEHFSPRASEMGSLVFSPCSCRGKCMLVIWVRVRRQNTLVLTRVFGVRVCSVSLCLFEFVKVCAGCCAPVSTDWLTPLPPSEYDSDSPDLSLWISLLFPWCYKFAWKWWLWLSHLLYLFLHWGCSGIATIVISFLYYRKAITHFH